jgi:hypothetical protein
MGQKKLQRSGERDRQDVRRGQEGYKATRLEKYNETRHFKKNTKIIAVVEEMKLIVRHDLVLRILLIKSSSYVDKAAEKETFAVRNDDPTVSNA